MMQMIDLISLLSVIPSNNVVFGLSVGDQYYDLGNQIETTDAIYILPSDKEGKVAAFSGDTVRLLRYDGTNGYLANHYIEFEEVVVPTKSLSLEGLITIEEGKVASETVATINGALNSRFVLHFGPIRDYRNMFNGGEEGEGNAEDELETLLSERNGYVTVAQVVWLTTDEDMDNFNEATDLSYEGSIRVELSKTDADPIIISHVTEMGDGSATEARDSFRRAIGEDGNGLDPNAMGSVLEGDDLSGIIASLEEGLIDEDGTAYSARLLARNVNGEGFSLVLELLKDIAMTNDDGSAMTNDDGSAMMAKVATGHSFELDRFAVVVTPEPTPSAEEGSTEEGSTEEGSTEEGSTEEGSTEEGSTEEGSTEEGSTEEGSTEEGSTEEGSTEEGSTEEGSAEEGSAEEGSTEEGSTEEGSAEEGSTEEGSTEEGSAEEGSAEEGSTTEECPDEDNDGVCDEPQV